MQSAAEGAVHRRIDIAGNGTRLIQDCLVRQIDTQGMLR